MKKYGGFTLIEWLVLVAVIALVGGVVALNVYIDVVAKALGPWFVVGGFLTAAALVAAAEIFFKTLTKLVSHRRVACSMYAMLGLGVVGVCSLAFGTAILEEKRHKIASAAVCNPLVRGDTAVCEGVSITDSNRRLLFLGHHDGSEAKAVIATLHAGEAMIFGRQNETTEAKYVSAKRLEFKGREPVVAVIVSSDGRGSIPRAELQLFTLRGNLINPEPFWLIGEILDVQAGSSGRPSVVLVTRSAVASWFFGALADHEALAFGVESARRATSVVELALDDACGLMGPLPASGGSRNARPIATIYRVPMVQERSGYIVTIRCRQPIGGASSVLDAVEVIGTEGGGSGSDTLEKRLVTGTLLISVERGTVYFLTVNSRRAQEFAAQILRDMAWTLDPDELREHFFNSNAGSLSPDDKALASDMIERMTKSTHLINNLSDMMFRHGKPTKAYADTLIARLLPAAESNRLGEPLTSSIFNTVGGLYAATNRFAEAIEPLKRSLQTPSPHVYADSTALLAICEHHLNREPEKHVLIANLRSAMAANPSIAANASGSWIRAAITLAAKPAFDATVRSASGECPATTTSFSVLHTAAPSPGRTTSTPRIVTTSSPTTPR